MDLVINKFADEALTSLGHQNMVQVLCLIVSQKMSYAFNSFVELDGLDAELYIVSPYSPCCLALPKSLLAASYSLKWFLSDNIAIGKIGP